MHLTLNMTGGTTARGYLITLPRPCSYVEITNLAATGGAWVQCINTEDGDTAAQPAATPAPAADATATYTPLLTPGANVIHDGAAGATSLTGAKARVVTHVKVWSTGNGNLVLVGQ